VFTGNVEDQSSPDFTASLARRLKGDTEVLSCDWWETETAAVIVDLGRSGSFIVALAGITEVLREGADPEWVVGTAHAPAAFKVAQEWVEAGVEPSDVAAWLRAGCWDARAARRMADAGIQVDQLLDDEGKPLHLVDVGPEGDVPLALAVAENYLAVEEAAERIAR
jgi:hypothetical protein